MKRTFRTWLPLGLLAWIVAIAMAATPAGTVIRNQAAALVENETYYSNTVETTVLPVCVPALGPDGTVAQPGQVSNATVGGTAYLTYVLSNEGNDAFTFALAAQTDAASAWTPTSLAVYLDANRNAQVDPGEQAVTQVTLAAGASAWLVLELGVPNPASGSAWVSVSASCPGGEQDAENYGEVRAVSGPALQVEKTFAPAEARPGEQVNVSLRVRNVGDAATGGAVTLSDDLQSLTGLRYVPGSAAAPKGQVEYFDGATWTSSEPASVQGLRLQLAGLALGEEAVLDFRMEVQSGATPQVIENRVRASGPGGPAETTASLRVLPAYGLNLGPVGNPRALPGGEGSADDRQQADLIVDQTYCFAHTLENASTAADTFDLRALGLPAGVDGTFNVTPTVPLSLPVQLEAGESLDFLFCVTASQVVPPFTVVLVAESAATGDTNRTYDEAARVLTPGEVVLEKRVDPQGTVTAGTELTYTLRFENRYPIPLTGVVVDDWLDPNLEYLGSAPAGVYDAARHRVRWQPSDVPAGGSWQAELRVRVKDGVPDDTLIENAFTLQSNETPNTLVSPTTRTPVWSSALLLEKRVTPREVRLGDAVHYTLRVHNPGTAALTLTLTDTPDPALRYIAGSARPSEPTASGGRLVWTGLTVGPGETLEVSYDLRVVAGATGTLHNVALAEGEGRSGAAVASGEARARVRVAEEVFLSRRATILGRVFLDVEGDGRYDPGVDVALPGARVVLADGRQAVTDVEGRYAFRDLEGGVWLVALDAASAPFPPLPHPEALGSGYRHRVAAYGVTVSDFPLAGPRGLIDAVRETQVFSGPLTVSKKVVPLGEGRFRVVLHLTSEEPVPGLVVRDPLPGGGERVFELNDFEGERTLTYDLEGAPVLTDPDVRWGGER